MVRWARYGHMEDTYEPTIVLYNTPEALNDFAEFFAREERLDFEQAQSFVSKSMPASNLLLTNEFANMYKVGLLNQMKTKDNMSKGYAIYLTS